jgi:thioredoxin 1
MNNDSPILDVVCLCADWCGVCRALRPQIQTLQISGCNIYWIDIEDHAAALEAIDIETFPAVIVADGHGAIYFAGTVEPHVAHFERLLKSFHPGSPASRHALSASSPWLLALQQLKRSGALGVSTPGHS